MKSFLVIVGLFFVLVMVVFVGHHVDMPGRVNQERSTLLGGGSNTSELIVAWHINMMTDKNNHNQYKK
jgi:hypothetical protein